MGLGGRKPGKWRQGLDGQCVMTEKRRSLLWWGCESAFRHAHLSFRRGMHWAETHGSDHSFRRLTLRFRLHPTMARQAATGTACRGLPALPPYAGGARTGVRATASPGAFINDACIIEPFMVCEQVQRNREPPWQFRLLPGGLGGSRWRFHLDVKLCQEGVVQRQVAFLGAELGE